MSSSTFTLFHSNIGIGEAIGDAIVGYCVVFLMLAILIVVIQVISKVLKVITKEEAQPAEVSAAAAAEEPAPALAPGSAGDLVIDKDVSDRDAAMIMAIVADALGKPVNTLRFKSIREVKEEE